MGKINQAEQEAVLSMSALRYQHEDVKKTLDRLRATRAARGGVGAPLAVPQHLRDAAAGHGIIVTDNDLNPNFRKPVEQEQDEASDLAAAIIRSERESQ